MKLNLILALMMTWSSVAFGSASRFLDGQFVTNGGGTATLFSSTDTIVGRATSDTLTNKVLSGNTAATLISGSGTLTLNTTGTITIPGATDTLVGRATTDTLTNKVLTGNTAANLISGSGTLVLNTTGTATIPNATDTLTGRATTDTLTNKSMSGSTNTFTNIPAGTALSGTVPVANGGTNSSTALNSNRFVVSSSGAIVEASAITAGQVVYTDANGLPAGSANNAWDNTNATQTISGATASNVSLAIQNSSSTFAANFRIEKNDNVTASNPAAILLRRSRGTFGSPSAAQNGDLLGSLVYRGYGTTAYQSSGARIYGQATENFTDTANGTQLVFQTTPNGSITSKTRATIGPAGAFQQFGDTSGIVSFFPAAVTTNYSIHWPASQGGSGTTLQNDGAGNLTWSSTGTGASQDLSNLTSPTAINQDLIFQKGAPIVQSADRTGVTSSEGISLVSGSAVDAVSGPVNIQSGPQTGTGGGTGDVVSSTGQSTNSDSGQNFMKTGDAGQNSGNLQMTTGNAGNNSGNIQMSTGTAVGSRGFVQIDAFGVNLANGTSLHFFNTGMTQHISFELPSTGTGTANYKLPFDGTNGQVLSTNGSGDLTWADAEVPPMLNGGSGGPALVTAAGGVVISSQTYKNKVWVVSNGGTVTVTATTSVTSCTRDGSELVIIGTSDTDKIILQDQSNLVGSGLSLNGNWTGKLDSVLSLVCDITRGLWVEMSRR